MNCRDCVYGYYLDEQGVVVCMADEHFLAPCEYDDDEEDWDELWEDEMDELWEEDLDI